mgnify:CR=1 FL=1
MWVLFSPRYASKDVARMANDATYSLFLELGGVGGGSVCALGGAGGAGGCPDDWEVVRFLTAKNATAQVTNGPAVLRKIDKANAAQSTAMSITSCFVGWRCVVDILQLCTL